jgi:hypothetical protein
MSAQKKIILLQRAIASRWLCTATSRQFTFVKATGNRYLSSVSPVFRHDDEEDHHDADQERKRANSNGAQRVLKRQAIKIQSPPVIDIKNQVTASTIERKFQQETATTSSRKTEKEEETTSSAFVSPKQLTYTGNATIPITSHLHLVQPGEDTPHGIWPVFRIMVSLVLYLCFIAHDASSRADTANTMKLCFCLTKSPRNTGRGWKFSGWQP